MYICLFVSGSQYTASVYVCACKYIYIYIYICIHNIYTCIYTLRVSVYMHEFVYKPSTSIIRL